MRSLSEIWGLASNEVGAYLYTQVPAFFSDPSMDFPLRVKMVFKQTPVPDAVHGVVIDPLSLQRHLRQISGSEESASEVFAEPLSRVK